MLASRHESGDMGHVHHQFGAHFICDFPELGKVDCPAVSRRPCDYDPGAVFLRQTLNFVIVDKLQLAVDSVWNEVVYLRREVHRAAVGQMSAVIKAETHHRVSGLQRGEVGGHVSLSATVRLNVGVICLKQLLGPLDGDLLGNVDELAPAVIAAPRIALGVLVGHGRPLSLHHSFAGVVLRGDQVYCGALPSDLVLDRLRDLRVLVLEDGHIINP